MNDQNRRTLNPQGGISLEKASIQAEIKNPDNPGIFKMLQGLTSLQTNLATELSHLSGLCRNLSYAIDLIDDPSPRTEGSTVEVILHGLLNEQERINRAVQTLSRQINAVLTV